MVYTHISIHGSGEMHRGEERHRKTRNAILASVDNPQWIRVRAAYTSSCSYSQTFSNLNVDITKKALEYRVQRQRLCEVTQVSVPVL